MQIINNNSNVFSYKSKTEDLLLEIKSLILSQKARIKYKKNQKPKEKKLLKIKNILTFFFFIPSQSANLEQTE